MTKTTFRTTVLAAAIGALATGAWAQTAPQNDAPAQAPATGTAAPAPTPAPSVITPADPDATTQSDQPIADIWITTKVKAELIGTHGVSASDVSVHTSDGVVVLTGVLASAEQVKKAEAAAQSVNGVREVDSSGLRAGS